MRTYTNAFISEIVNVALVEGDVKAIRKARKDHGVDLAESTVRTWRGKAVDMKGDAKGDVIYVQSKRGAPVKMPEEVEKFVLKNLELYQSKGVTINHLVTRFV